MLIEIVPEAAGQMLAEALQAELDASVDGFAAERDANRRWLVIRNGSQGSHEV